MKPLDVARGGMGLLACLLTALAPSCSTYDPDACAAERQALKSLIETHSACESAADCQFFRSFCLFEGRVDCTGAFYMNREVTAEEFKRLDVELGACVAENAPNGTADCGHCGMGEAPAACIDGRCGPELIE